MDTLHTDFFTYIDHLHKTNIPIRQVGSCVCVCDMLLLELDYFMLCISNWYTPSPSPHRFAFTTNFANSLID